MRRKMCIYKCMLNVYKNQQSRQTGSRNLMGPKMLPTIWNTYMTLVTKYQISAINSYWEKCDEKYLGQTNRGKTVYPPPPSGYKKTNKQKHSTRMCTLLNKSTRLDKTVYLESVQILLLKKTWIPRCRPISYRKTSLPIPLIVKINYRSRFYCSKLTHYTVYFYVF